MELSFGGTTNYYASMQDAIAAVSGGDVDNPVTIGLLADITISSAAKAITLAGGKHIRLVPEGASRTITRDENGFGSLFTVEDDASLTLAGDGENELIIDGGADNGKTATDALVMVDGGTLTMYDGATVQNNNNTSYSGDCGGVFVESGAAFTMEGGSVEGNKSKYGAGVYVNGTFTMNGGVIKENTAEGYNSAVGSYSRGGGIFVYFGTCYMNGGEISNNTATYGGGVALQSDTVAFIKKSDDCFVYGTDNTALTNTATSSGVSLYLVWPGASIARYDSADGEMILSSGQTKDDTF
jgi:hypothetical protein